jgi:superkiller protein 3
MGRKPNPLSRFERLVLIERWSYHRSARAIATRKLLLENEFYRDLSHFELLCYQEALDFVSMMPDSASTWHRLGEIYLRNDNLPDGRRAMERAHTIGPHFDFTNRGMGSTCIFEGNPDEALPYLQQAVEIDPTNPWNHQVLGHAYADLLQYEAAQACYEHVLILDHYFEQAWVSIGDLLRRQGKVDPAIAAYQKAIALDPKCDLALTSAARLLQHVGRYHEAIPAYRRLITVVPDHAAAWMSLGECYEGIQKWKQAIEALEKSIQLDPNHLSAYYRLGIVCHKLKQWDKCVAAWHAFLIRDPQHVDSAAALSNLALTYCNQGRYDMAMKQYDRLKAMNSILAPQTLRDIEDIFSDDE